MTQTSLTFFHGQWKFTTQMRIQIFGHKAEKLKYTAACKVKIGCERSI